MLSIREQALFRSRVYRVIRDFFESIGCVEVETPILSPHLIPESCLEVFATTRYSLDGHSEPLYLLPSPELFMKKLLSQEIGNCFQLARVFRNLEPTAQEGSTKHLFEFCMLEWYLLGQSYRDNIQVTQSFLRELAPFAAVQTRHLFERFSVVSMQGLFLDQLNIDLKECQDLSRFKSIASDAGFQHYADNSNSWAELFQFLFVSELENHFSEGRTVFLTDYPAQMPTTAKKAGHCYERWELYMDNWEIANCYTEETSLQVMQVLFKEEQQAKQGSKVPHKVDSEYLTLFNSFPECSGVALGVDRLMARLLGHEEIVAVGTSQ